MLTLDHAQRLVTTYEKMRNTVNTDVLKFVQTQTDVPVEERWKIFCRLPLDPYPYIIDITIDGNEISWYDNFWYEKYETVCFENVVDRLINDVYDGYLFDKDEIDSVLVKFKEDVMKTGYNQFVFDW